MRETERERGRQRQRQRTMFRVTFSLYFGVRVSLYSTGWPQNQHVAKYHFELLLLLHLLIECMNHGPINPSHHHLVPPPWINPLSHISQHQALSTLDHLHHPSVLSYCPRCTLPRSDSLVPSRNTPKTNIHTQAHRHAINLDLLLTGQNLTQM